MMAGGLGGGQFGGPPDPQMQKLTEEDHRLDNASRQLAEKIRRLKVEGERSSEGAAGENVDELRKKLAAIVEAHFRIRQEKRKIELERLEKQIAKLRDSLRGRDDKKASIVERRIAELVGAEDTGF